LNLTIIPRRHVDRYAVHQRVMAGFPSDYEGRVLFRLAGEVVIVVSPDVPNYEQVIKQEALEVPLGHTRFTLEANPTVKQAGRRCPLTDVAELEWWFARKLKTETDIGLAFSAVVFSPPSSVRAKQGVMVFNRVVYSGLVSITDVAKAERFIAAGIGPAKGLGFGLLLTERMLS